MTITLLFISQLQSHDKRDIHQAYEYGNYLNSAIAIKLKKMGHFGPQLILTLRTWHLMPACEHEHVSGSQ